MGLRETVPPSFRLIWGTVCKNVETMPEEGLGVKPDGLETRSFREIALHMANSCTTFGENIGRATWERVLAFPPEQHTSKSQVLAALAQGGDRFLAGVSRLSDEEVARIVKTPWGAEMPQGQLVAGQVSHMFYHNGQLAIYLRMQGVKPFFLVR